MATNEIVTSIQSNIEKLSHLLEKNLERREEWGKINFDEAHGIINDTKWIVSNFHKFDWHRLPNTACALINCSTAHLINTLTSIDAFQVDAHNPQSFKKEHLDLLQQHFDAFYGTTIVWIPYLAYSSGDLEKRNDDYKAQFRQAIDLANNHINDVVKAKDEIAKITQSVKDAAGITGVTKYAEHFQKEAETLRSSSWWWIGITILSVVLTIGCFALLTWLYSDIKDPTTNQLVQISITKIASMALLISASIWCGRNYKAIKHQEALCKHRSLSLQTFQSFVSSTTDPHIKDTVLLEAARSIFTPINPGFVTDADSEFNNVIQLADLARGGNKP